MQVKWAMQNLATEHGGNTVEAIMVVKKTNKTKKHYLKGYFV